MREPMRPRQHDLTRAELRRSQRKEHRSPRQAITFSGFSQSLTTIGGKLKLDPADVI